jgi:hypothetical protein
MHFIALIGVATQLTLTHERAFTTQRREAWQWVTLVSKVLSRTHLQRVMGFATANSAPVAGFSEHIGHNAFAMLGAGCFHPQNTRRTPVGCQRRFCRTRHEVFILQCSYGGLHTAVLDTLTSLYTYLLDGQHPQLPTPPPAQHCCMDGPS